VDVLEYHFLGNELLGIDLLQFIDLRGTVLHVPHAPVVVAMNRVSLYWWYIDL
jgi:hypothetical protein